MSGGGGWGQKQGLLSLDPETTISTESKEQAASNEEEESEEQQISGLGDLAKAGSWIQFFAADTDRAGPNVEPSKDLTYGPDKWTRSTVIGTTRSTIDDVPLARPSDTAPMIKRAVAPDTILQIGHFGAVSERGVFLHWDRDKRLNSTKIDLPYSYFYQTNANRHSRFNIGPSVNTPYSPRILMVEE